MRKHFEKLAISLGLFSLLATLLVQTAKAEDSPDQGTFGYIQYGQWDSAREAALGLYVPGPIQFHGDDWTTFWSLEVGEWLTRKDNASSRASSELAIGPIGRYYFDTARDFYFQGMAGFAAVAPRFWRGSEQQGSVLNFVGSFAFGYRFGHAKSSEISLGAGHVSNGGLSEPNPGRNFFQLRYATSF
jgi:hypothetical protein